MKTALSRFLIAAGATGLFVSAVPAVAQLSPAESKAQRDLAAREAAARAQAEREQAAASARASAAAKARAEKAERAKRAKIAAQKAIASRNAAQKAKERGDLDAKRLIYVRSLLDSMMTNSPSLRYLEDDDCNCKSLISDIRTGRNGYELDPFWHPYWLSGDFNGDKVIDFAIVLYAYPYNIIVIVHGIDIEDGKNIIFQYDSREKVNNLFSVETYAASLEWDGLCFAYIDDKIPSKCLDAVEWSGYKSGFVYKDKAYDD